MIHVGDLPGIRRPNRMKIETTGLAEIDVARRAGTILITNLEFIFAGGIGKVGNPFAVGRPGRGTLGNAGSVGNVAGVALFVAGTVKISPWDSNAARAPVGEIAKL